MWQEQPHIAGICCDFPHFDKRLLTVTNAQQHIDKYHPQWVHAVLQVYTQNDRSTQEHQLLYSAQSTTSQRIGRKQYKSALLLNKDCNTSSFLCIPPSCSTQQQRGYLAGPSFPSRRTHYAPHSSPCLMYSFSASQRVFRLLALASLNLSHASAFCFCCKGVRSSSKPTLQPASFPLALKTFFFSATLPNSTMTRPGLASPSLLRNV